MVFHAFDVLKWVDKKKMNGQKVFLTANWDYLLLINYAVSQTVLTPFLPKDCELSLWNNQAFVSIVGFQFNNTRIFKVKWPYFTHFLEINLRFYLHYKGRRAVRFIREYVPSYLIAGIARWTYNEPYKTRKIETSFIKNSDTINVEYKMPVKNHPFAIGAEAYNKPCIPNKSSAEYFFKEHDLGIGQTKKGRTLFYNVYHPEWRVFPIKNSFAQIDWTFFYGPHFSFLNNSRPHSVFLAEGSRVKVFKYKLV